MTSESSVDKRVEICLDIPTVQTLEEILNRASGSITQESFSKNMAGFMVNAGETRFRYESESLTLPGSRIYLDFMQDGKQGIILGSSPLTEWYAPGKNPLQIECNYAFIPSIETQPGLRLIVGYEFNREENADPDHLARLNRYSGLLLKSLSIFDFRNNYDLFNAKENPLPKAESLVKSNVRLAPPAAEPLHATTAYPTHSRIIPPTRITIPIPTVRDSKIIPPPSVPVPPRLAPMADSGVIAPKPSEVPQIISEMVSPIPPTALPPLPGIIDKKSSTGLPPLPPLPKLTPAKPNPGQNPKFIPNRTPSPTG